MSHLKLGRTPLCLSNLATDILGRTKHRRPSGDFEGPLSHKGAYSLGIFKSLFWYLCACACVRVCVVSLCVSVLVLCVCWCEGDGLPGSSQ